MPFFNSESIVPLTSLQWILVSSMWGVFSVTQGCSIFCNSWSQITKKLDSFCRWWFKEIFVEAHDYDAAARVTNLIGKSLHAEDSDWFPTELWTLAEQIIQWKLSLEWCKSQLFRGRNVMYIGSFHAIFFFFQLSTISVFVYPYNFLQKSLGL